ncbi:alpha/beta fold hydrolase [Gleimia sp. 6138-11-ORH1]|uniref:alpha/beta fold hydrolase n=1 Tax=Gleimia sp. 6138-11-ORH1 TaxID=2973937 RepID=UPI002167AC9B|nr:alpha/beta fold hydrolase [Gleimia sp. 6138-11-ORH1]MCS4484819.1 alpha/beta fold hydrolase [Gleimia sp. 6138-11-ORH1]
MTIIAAADGSALKNPGPTGWAWAIDESSWRAGGFAHGTNNIGELYAVLDLLQATAEVNEPLHILADSQYVINTFTKWIYGWKRKGWKKADGSAVLNVELIKQIDELLQGRVVTWEWVKGHSGHALNEFVDKKARAAASAYKESSPVESGPGLNLSKVRAYPTNSEGTSIDFAAEHTSPAQTAPKSSNAKTAAQAEMDLFSFSTSSSLSGSTLGSVENSSLPSSVPPKETQGNTENPALVEESAKTAPSKTVISSERIGAESVNTYKVRGLNVADHFLTVPLDHADPNGTQITLFVREICDGELGDIKKPALIYMQGGPGGRGPRPGDYRSGWIGEALKKYRVLLLDQRGTGLSTRLDEDTLSTFRTAPEAANYLKFFRADSIVKDAELVRARFNGGKSWVSLGQSYGGFINTTYLSLYPEALEAVFFTGGLPGLTSIDEIYTRTYLATAERNKVYFSRFQQDERVLRDLIAHLQSHEEKLPNGEVLSAGRLRMLGLLLGGQSGFDRLHYFFEAPFSTVNGEKRLSKQFLDSVYREVSMGDSPLYALMHETIYAGALASLSGTATNWGAWRLLEQVGSKIPEGFAFNPDPRDLSTPVYLTGEHIYPWLFEEDFALKPLKEVADLLAKETAWPVLYDEGMLASSEVPAAAAVYFEDMFVPTELSLRTAELAKVRTWVTNEFQHDGLRMDGARIFERLSSLAFE